MENPEIVGNLNDLLKDVGIVNVPDKVIMAMLLNVTDTVIDIDRVNAGCKKGVLYFAEDGRCLEAKNDDEAIEADAAYKVVPTGYKQGITDYDLCASFARKENYWNGVFIGTVPVILQGIYNRWNALHTDKRYSRDCPDLFCARKLEIVGCGWSEVYAHNKVYLSKNVRLGYIGNTTESSRNSDDILASIYGDVMTPEIYGKKWRTRLRQHLKWMISCIAEDQKLLVGTEGNGYILLPDRSTALINTGILDKFGNDIFIIDFDNKIYNMESKRLTRAYSKSYMIEAGFSFEALKSLPAPIKFFSDRSDLVFDGDENSLDLGSTSGMAHIIDSRRSRLPSEYRDLPSSFIFDKIKMSILNAVKISKRDYRYIIPIYQTNNKSIAYLFPLKLAAEGVQGAIVVTKSHGYYSPTTILTLDDAYMDASLICNPTGSWLDAQGKEYER